MKLLKKIGCYAVTIYAVSSLLVGCGGGSCPSDGGSGPTPTPTPTSSPTPSPNLSLQLTAPNQYPAGVPVTAYLTIKNTSASDATNLQYSIPPKNTQGNNTGVDISVDPKGAGQDCTNIVSGGTCVFTANIPAGSVPGSFTVTAVSDSSSLVIGKLQSLLGLNATTLTLTAYIGLTDLPANNLTGANGITLLYAQSVESYPNNESTPVIITAVVNSASAGSFNTINLVDKNGNKLSFNPLSGNSGNGKPNLSQGSIVTFLLNIPANTSIYPVYVQTANNSTLVDTSSNSGTIYLTGKRGFITALPYLFNLNQSYSSQQITFTNPSDTKVTDLSFVANGEISIESDPSSKTCGNSLESGASCFITIKGNVNQTLAQSNASVVAIYKNPVDNAQVLVNGTVTGQATAGGLLITSSQTLNFLNNSFIESMSTILTIKNTGTTTIDNGYGYIGASVGVSLSPELAQSYFVASGGSCTLTNSSLFYPTPLIAITNVLQPGESCTVIMTYNSNGQYVAPSNASLVATYFYNNGNDQGTTAGLPVTYTSYYSGIGVTLHADSPTGRVIDNNVIGQGEYFYIVYNLVNESGTIPTQTITASSDNNYVYPDGDSCQITNAVKSCSIKAYNPNGGSTQDLKLSASGGLAVSPAAIPLYIAKYAYVANISNGGDSTYNDTDVYKCMYNDSTGLLYPYCKAQKVAEQLNINNFNPQKIVTYNNDALFITDSNNGKVDLCMINESGNLTSCANTGSGYQFTNAHGVAISNQGYMYVSTQNNGVNGITTCSISPVQVIGDRPELFDCSFANPFGATNVNNLFWIASADYSYSINSDFFNQNNLWYGTQLVNNQSYQINQSESAVNRTLDINGLAKANTESNSLAYNQVNNSQFSALTVQYSGFAPTWLMYANLNDTQIYSCNLYYEYTDPAYQVGSIVGSCNATGSNFTQPDDIYLLENFAYISNLTRNTDISVCAFDNNSGSLSNCQASGAGTFSGARAFYIIISKG